MNVDADANECSDNDPLRDCPCGGVKGTPSCMFPDNDDPFLETLCSSIVAVVLNITQTVKEHYPMAQLPAPQVKTPQTSVPKNVDMKNRTGLPFLSPANQDKYLSLDTKVEVMILDCKLQEVDQTKKVYSPVLLKISIANTTMLYGLSLKNPNYERLVQIFGSDSDAWSGKKFNMTLDKDKFDEKIWIRVEAIPVTKKAA